MMRATTRIGCVLAALAWSGAALAVLPPPTPEQARAAAAKKAAADAKAQQDKAELQQTMDRIVARWRAGAAAKGWATHPAVAVAAAPTAAPAAPIRSEKLGTAPPSADVKAGPTKAMPAGAKPGGGKQ
jgi:colicin import membrane protein